MQKIGPDPNHNSEALNNTRCRSPLGQNANIDPPPGFCDVDPLNQNNVPNNPQSWFEENSMMNKTGNGTENNCDDLQSGSIVNDLETPNRNTLFRYSKSLRGTDEAVMDMFRDIVVLDEDGKAIPVPIIWGTAERAVLAIVQENVRKDDTLVVDRLRLPMMAVVSRDLTFNQNRYTYHKAIDWLRDKTGKPGFYETEKYKRDTVFGVTRGIPIDVSYQLIFWTMYLEDANQILEQILTKFSPIAYIKVRGVSWETILKLDGISNNLEIDVGDQALRIIKFQVNMTAETYVAQPIIRKKAVLETRIEVVNSTVEENITEVISRIENSVKQIGDCT
jgi:hypothetical protein